MDEKFDLIGSKGEIDVCQGVRTLGTDVEQI